ncbi:MAG: hypothetical protein ND895_14435 [Pyrinomonadaceae bacterium]|nr:hypothetical protein [Pyrinomonadaceae bacterium]
MRHPKVTLPVLLLTLALSPMPRMPSPAQTNARQVAGGGTVLFSLTKDIYGVFHMEPIVIISGGKYTPPPTEDEAAAKKFSDTYFRTGRQYRVVFGGGDAGSLTVQKYEKDQCLNLVADVGVQTTARLGGEVQALAVSSDKISSGASSRRAPTEGERAAAVEVARALYGQRGVGAALVKKMKTVNLTATDIERDGKFELIGSFEIDAGNEIMHNLFIILEPTATEKYKAAWNWYHKGNEDGNEDRKLVDAFDLDGDGTAEVIAEGHTLENHDYAIYKRQAGTWRPIYKGGGGGAC